MSEEQGAESAPAKGAEGEIVSAIREAFPDWIVEPVEGAGDLTLRVRAGEPFREAMRFLRDDGRLRFDLLSCIVGIDYPDRSEIEVTYCLTSTVRGHDLLLKVSLPRRDPRIPTVENLWRTADWHERETWDLLGVVFEGHHNLVRILCAEDWVGHPLRKDYVIPDTYHGIKNVVY